ncbi:MAG: hypothetical protein J6A45_01230 [Lachnospiraceae bacterium]|nr:hypothetical protein [Lachnospiraceae bacterium]
MSEVLAAGAGSMYDEVQAVQNLNKVDGFDPRKYMRLIGAEGQAGKYYLDVAIRKLWFRLKYPEGKIDTRLVYQADHTVIAEARIYLHYKDAENEYIANAFSQKFRTEDPQFGDKFVELAGTAAEGRALANAGFGTQFADIEGTMDPEVVDAPFDAKFFAGNEGMSYLDECDQEIIQQTNEDEQSDMIPGQFGIESYIPMPGEPSRPMTPNQVQNPAMSNRSPNVQPPAGNAPQQVTRQPEIRKDMPLEQIYALLTPETAAAVVINIGFNKGKTLGQLAVEKPASLDWYVNAYEGPDNLLRAAAKYLMDAALQKAS